MDLLRAVRRRFDIAFNCFLCFATLTTIALAKATLSSAEKRTQIEGAIKNYLAVNNLPGAAVAVVENGEVSWASGFGMADLENSIPATSSTLFRLASISKTITATAAMLLYQEGKLDLDAPIQKYCPAYPQKEYAVSTRQLLGHMGGVRNYRTNPLTDPESTSIKHFDDPIGGGLTFFKDDPLIFKPGTKFGYSNHGYILIGCVIEGASGQKYADFVRESILLPVGMTHTRLEDRLAIIPNRTRFYSKDPSGNVVNAEPIDVSFRLPADGWLSSAEDMTKFEAAMLNDRIVTRGTRDLMWTSQKTPDGKETYYGLGWQIGHGFADTINHGGGDFGTSTFLMIAPKENAAVILLINLNGANAENLAPDLLKIVLGIDPSAK